MNNEKVLGTTVIVMACIILFGGSQMDSKVTHERWQKELLFQQLLQYKDSAAIDRFTDSLRQVYIDDLPADYNQE